VYDVMAEPPLLTGGVNVIVASPLPRTAVTLVGAFGVVAGVIELLVDDEELVPFAFVAVTVNVYIVPLVRPVIKVLVAFVVVTIPVFDVIVYEVIGEPPLLAGAVNETVV
jgi:hypothetical protein